MANGLTQKEQRALSHTLSKLEAVGATRAHMLGREGRQMLLLTEKIRGRLNPPSPESLQAEADRLFEVLEGCPVVEVALRSMH
jgi:hypothetical protein